MEEMEVLTEDEEIMNQEELRGLISGLFETLQASTTSKMELKAIRNKYNAAAGLYNERAGFKAVKLL